MATVTDTVREVLLAGIGFAAFGVEKVQEVLSSLEATASENDTNQPVVDVSQ